MIIVQIPKTSYAPTPTHVHQKNIKKTSNHHRVLSCQVRGGATFPEKTRDFWSAGLWAKKAHGKVERVGHLVMEGSHQLTQTMGFLGSLVITNPTQTMHYYKGNLSKLSHICMRLIPPPPKKKWYFNDPLQRGNEHFTLDGP